MDLVGLTKTYSSILPQSSSTTVNGATVDALGWEDAHVVLHCGATASTGTLDVKVETSANDSDWADVPDAVFPQVTPTNDNAIYVARLKLATKDCLRYIRATGVAATAASIYGVSFILSSNNGISAGDAGSEKFQEGWS